MSIDTGDASRSVEFLEGITAHPGTIAEYRRLMPWIALTDALAILFALLSAHVMTHGAHFPANRIFIAVYFAPVMFVLIFAAMHLYSVYQFGAAEELRRLFLGVTSGVTMVVLIAFWTNATINRLWVALVWILSVVLAVASRKVWHVWIHRRRQVGHYVMDTIVVGTNDEALGLAKTMRPNNGLRPVGFVTGDDPGAGPRAIEGLPVLGGLDDLAAIIRDTSAECVFVASTALDLQQMQAVTKSIHHQDDLELRISANLPPILLSRLALQPVGSRMALSVRPARLTPMQSALKRGFDLAVGGIITLLMLPLLGAIALLVKLTSPGPVLFRQERIGQNGRPFVIKKFRTMRVGAEAMQESLLDRNAAEGPLFKVENDPRVTRVGKVLRGWSLDELPQLFNVLAGDMSLVGPRPVMRREVEQYEDWHMQRLDVRPGVTGLAQASGRINLAFDEFARMDIFYIENWSLAYDVVIIAKTIPALLSRTGAY